MIDWKTIVSKISLGKLYPSMRISLVDSVTPEGMRPAISIVMTVSDACETDLAPMSLFQCDPIPVGLETEEAAVEWIYSRVKAVLLHELDEFFRFDGRIFKRAQHPLS